jgi:hypothetical protein
MDKVITRPCALRAGDFFCPKRRLPVTNLNAYRDIGEIEAVVRHFEACAYCTSEFTHARHLTVAALYLSSLPPEAALDRMRQSLVRFTAHHGVKGYHETITRFWMTLVSQFLEAQPEGTPLIQGVNLVVEKYPRKSVLFEYYSEARVMSEEARRQWVPPDLKKLGSVDLNSSSSSPAQEPATADGFPQN